MFILTRKFIRALKGLGHVLSTDTSLRLQALIGAMVLLAGWVLGLGRLEMSVLVLAVFFVIMLEGVNSILERLLDIVEPRYREPVRDAKDALAGLVFLAALAAGVVGILVFFPHVYPLSLYFS